MSIKKIKVISAIVAFFLAFPLHFIYEWFPNSFTAIFFPVNESIWEHMKLLFDALLLVGILEYFVYHHFDIEVSNLLFSTWFGAIISIPIYLILYLPIYYKMGEAMWWNLLCMAIVILIIQGIQTWILKQQEKKWINIGSIPLMILTYIAFAYLTFYPIHTHLFFDTLEEKYGLSDYRIVHQKTDEYY